jgi:hypothetical protein
MKSQTQKKPTTASPMVRSKQVCAGPATLRKVSRRAVWVASAGFLLPAAITAGPIITNNLPGGTAIVNISATQSGAASHTGDWSLWYSPFFTGGAAGLLQYTVQAGTYDFRVIDGSDAAQLFPALTAADTNDIFTAWNSQLSASPRWHVRYLVFPGGAAQDSSVACIINLGQPGEFYSAVDAYNAAATNDYFRSTYTFTNSQTLIFAISDSYLADNASGQSVLVTPVPTNPPVLTILLASNHPPTLTFQWSTSAAGYILQESLDLQAAWTNTTNVPAITGTNYSVTLAANRAMFFRLYRP